MDRLRIGVIGLGWFGEFHCDAIMGVPNLELAALCTRTPERLKAMAAKFGVGKTTRDYRELLADPGIDAVSIVTMWDQHTEPAVAALEAGKHVFLEKPIASTVEDAARSSLPPRAQRAFCKSATSAASIRAIGWRSRRSRRARSAKSSR